jgi:hypothetical protein
LPGWPEGKQEKHVRIAGLRGELSEPGLPGFEAGNLTYSTVKFGATSANILIIHHKISYI